MPIPDPVFQPAPCDPNYVRNLFCDQWSWLNKVLGGECMDPKLMESVVFFNGYRHPFTTYLCAIYRPRTRPDDPYDTESVDFGATDMVPTDLFEWILQREMRKAFRMGLWEHHPEDPIWMQFHSNMLARRKRLLNAILADDKKLHVFTQKFRDEPFLPARLGALAQFFWTLRQEDAENFLSDIEKGWARWADYYQDFIRPAVLPYVLEDAAYGSLDTLRNEQQTWREIAGNVAGPIYQQPYGYLSAPPPAPPPPPWIDNIWPLINAASGQLAQIPGVPRAPCTPFPKCIIEQTGIDVNKLWDIVEAAARKFPGLILVRDRNGPRYPKNYPGTGRKVAPVAYIEDPYGTTPAGYERPEKTSGATKAMIAIGAGAAFLLLGAAIMSISHED
jgi:hypothetical protein